MLKDLEQYFTQRGWYVGEHVFLDIRLEGGFEAFSGRASETWEYRWIVSVNENLELKIPNIVIKGRVYESLDDVCKRVLIILNK